MIEISDAQLEETPYTVVALINMYEGLAYGIEELQKRIDQNDPDTASLLQQLKKYTEMYQRRMGFLPERRNEIKNRMLQIIDPQPTFVVEPLATAG